jgi:type VI secretion system secreted protein VgrG
MFVHGERPMKLTTPLGEDKLLLIGLTGHEGISELFHYQLDLVSDEDTVDFDKLLGQKVSIEWRIDEGESRYFWPFNQYQHLHPQTNTH